jgi:hypothetical protein
VSLVSFILSAEFGDILEAAQLVALQKLGLKGLIGIYCRGKQDFGNEHFNKEVATITDSMEPIDPLSLAQNLPAVARYAPKIIRRRSIG